MGSWALSLLYLYIVIFFLYPPPATTGALSTYGHTIISLCCGLNMVYFYLTDAAKRIKNMGQLFLSYQDVLAIKRRLWDGHKVLDVANEFSISAPYVSNISRGRAWDGIPWPDGSCGAMPVQRKRYIKTVLRSAASSPFRRKTDSYKSVEDGPIEYRDEKGNLLYTDTRSAAERRRDIEEIRRMYERLDSGETPQMIQDALDRAKKNMENELANPKPTPEHPKPQTLADQKKLPKIEALADTNGAALLAWAEPLGLEECLLTVMAGLGPSYWHLDKVMKRNTLKIAEMFGVEIKAAAPPSAASNALDTGQEDAVTKDAVEA